MTELFWAFLGASGISVALALFLSTTIVKNRSGLARLAIEEVGNLSGPEEDAFGTIVVVIDEGVRLCHTCH
ncbi:hypothetical protein ANO14919_109410 [Xylariales sp. No.14919]|nr:hypothetical protein ANO14919_109410 [Xylariales sp. No.14919]